MGIDFAADLNDEQYRAATAGDGPLLILAAAGTGKTRTLVYRVAYLVEQGIAPDRILLLTFTNRAAREMLERACSLVGTDIGGMWGGTFHHMSNRILRQYADLIGYRRDYTILDQDDTRSMITSCVKALKLNSKEFPRRDVLHSLFGAAANTGRDLRHIIDDKFDELEVDPDGIVAVQGEYETRKRELHAMDFDDLLVNCLELFSKHPDVLAQYQRRFLYVLVDEYQDTNSIQARLVDSVSTMHGNLLVVGDDFQSIYSWRGADYRNILSFPERYAGTQIHKLETNYRSVPEILTVANRCIEGNPEQFRKVLKPTREPYQRPKVVHLRDGDTQAQYVVDEIRRLRRKGVGPGDIAILYRAHFHAMELQMTLTRERMPYEITSGIRFFEQAHVKDVCSLLRVLVSTRDALAFGRFLSLLQGVGPKTVEKVWREIKGEFHAGSVEQQEQIAKKLRGVSRSQWELVTPLLTRHANDVRDAAAIVDEFLDAFYIRHAEAAYENSERRLDDVREMALKANDSESIEAFLSEIALLTNLDAEADVSRGAGEAAIRLSTVHQAKGLEWPAVIILWATEGMFPSSRSVSESEDGAAEERRLFYVAVTRAKDELTLCVPEVRRMRDGGVYWCQPSRFVEELDSELVEELRPGYW